MKHIYEYLIGGKKTGNSKHIPTFGELAVDDPFYVYEVNDRHLNGIIRKYPVRKIERRNGCTVITYHINQGLNYYITDNNLKKSFFKCEDGNLYKLYFATTEEEMKKNLKSTWKLEFENNYFIR